MAREHTEHFESWRREPVIELNVKDAVKQISRDLDKLGESVRDKAVVMAMNKTIAKGRTEMTRAITAEYRIKATDVRARLKLIRAQRGRLSAELNPFASGRGRSLNLIHFLESKVTVAQMRKRRKDGTQKDLRFNIKKSGGAKTIRGAFIGNKGRTIFQRTGDARLPIKAVSTVGVPQMFNTKRIQKRVIERIEREFPVEFERAAKRVIDRFNR